VAIPAPPDIAEAVQSVSVTHNDEGRSGFQIVLQVGRAGPTDLLDYRLLLNPLLRPFNRVILTIIFNAIPTVLMDGVITNQQFSPGNQPGAATLTLTGEDVSVMMDMVKVRAEHPAQSESLIVLKIIGSYARYGLIPVVIPPLSFDQPVPTERTPVQQGTDLEYLKQMAGRFGYVFYIEPGPAPFTNKAYWGPPVRNAFPQRALSVNMGPQTNVDSINFTYNALAPMIVADVLQDRQTNRQLPVVTFFSSRLPPLASMPALPFNLPNVRTSLLENAKGGLTYAQAAARAQASTDRSVDAVVSASGELNALRYGDLLRPRGIVGLRGAGFTYDGLYYVKSTSHSISKGQYKQRFNLTREGTGSLTSTVTP
jgi:hypothetical protein